MTKSKTLDFVRDAQLEVFPDALDLLRIEPSHNMRRFYRMFVQPDLFGGAAVVREWGRIGLAGKMGQSHHPDQGVAINALNEIAKAKRKRGYK